MAKNKITERWGEKNTIVTEKEEAMKTKRLKQIEDG